MSNAMKAIKISKVLFQKNQYLPPHQRRMLILIKGVCTKCSQRFYFDSSKACQPVNDLCSIWDYSEVYTACYDGTLSLEELALLLRTHMFLITILLKIYGLEEFAPNSLTELT